MASIRFNAKDAVMAVRGEFRAHGIDPESESAKQAWAMLDNMMRQDRSLLVSQWYLNSTDSQQRQFDREWVAKQKDMARLKSLRMTPERATQDAIAYLRRQHGVKPEAITFRMITDEALSGDMAVLKYEAAVWFASSSKSDLRKMKAEYDRWHRTYENNDVFSRWA